MLKKRDLARRAMTLGSIFYISDPYLKMFDKLKGSGWSDGKRDLYEADKARQCASMHMAGPAGPTSIPGRFLPTTETTEALVSVHSGIHRLTENLPMAVSRTMKRDRLATTVDLRGDKAELALQKAETSKRRLFEISGETLRF
jgi:hypothetical protein